MKHLNECPICSSVKWVDFYNGPIRDGVYGVSVKAKVISCGNCGLRRLDEPFCLRNENYESTKYRDALNQGTEIQKHKDLHKDFIKFMLEILQAIPLNKKIIADIGCGGGVLLDYLTDIDGKLIAVEPAQHFAEYLKSRGYDYYPDMSSLQRHYSNEVNLIISSQVIEHVYDPKVFLDEIFNLLAKDGIAVISTPNVNDILMEMMPDHFPSFFYRTQHRWYFSSADLVGLAKRVGFTNIQIIYVHRYELDNALYWLRDKAPKSRSQFPGVESSISASWKTYLSNVGKTDNLFAILRK